MLDHMRCAGPRLRFEGIDVSLGNPLEESRSLEIATLETCYCGNIRINYVLPRPRIGHDQSVAGGNAAGCRTGSNIWACSSAPSVLPMTNVERSLRFDRFEGSRRVLERQHELGGVVPATLSCRVSKPKPHVAAERRQLTVLFCPATPVTG
jgi:hypothetical protein